MSESCCCPKEWPDNAHRKFLYLQWCRAPTQVLNTGKVFKEGILVGIVESDTKEDRTWWVCISLLAGTAQHWLLSPSHFNFPFERDQTIFPAPSCLFYFLWSLGITQLSSQCSFLLADAFILSPCCRATSEAGGTLPCTESYFFSNQKLGDYLEHTNTVFVPGPVG